MCFEGGTNKISCRWKVGFGREKEAKVDPEDFALSCPQQSRKAGGRAGSWEMTRGCLLDVLRAQRCRDSPETSRSRGRECLQFGREARAEMDV